MVVLEHKKLDAWKTSIELVTDIYSIVNSFPKEEMFGLTMQIKRAVVSIPSNIAEGCSRQTKPDAIRFLYIALGSLSETETQLIVAEKLGYCSFDNTYISEKLMDVKNLILGTIRFLSR